MHAHPAACAAHLIHVDAGDFGVALTHHFALKLEFLQHTGSFKPRGARSATCSRAPFRPGIAPIRRNHARPRLAGTRLGHKAVSPDVAVAHQELRRRHPRRRRALCRRTRRVRKAHRAKRRALGACL
jgi:hypothetical protein